MSEFMQPFYRALSRDELEQRKTGVQRRPDPNKPSIMVVVNRDKEVPYLRVVK